MADLTTLTRPIIGIENRTAQEVFDIMCDRIRAAESPAPVPHLMGSEQATKAAFNHGYLLACCNIVNLHDEPGIAFDTLVELGISKTEVKAMDLTEYDLKSLRKIERERGGKSLYRKSSATAQPAPADQARVTDSFDRAKAEQAFTDYFVRNYPGPDTVIFNPNWHAPKLFAAALQSIREATIGERP